MEIWIPITIVAAFCQNLRSALQKHLKGKLSTGGATYVRFFYAWPFAVLYVFGLNTWGEMPIPEIKGLFLLYCVLGGLSQIIFTGLLVWLFSFRNFAVGTTFSKTETVQVALLAFLLLGDTLTLGAIFAIVVSVMGVMAMSLAQTNITFKTLFTGLTEKSTMIGLASGLFLGASVVFFRGAALELDYDMVALPGGLPGSDHLGADDRVTTRFREGAGSFDGKPFRTRWGEDDSLDEGEEGCQLVRWQLHQFSN